MKVKINTNISHNYCRELLKNRGVSNVDKFLNPDESCLQDWRDLENIVKGVDAIHTLHNNGEVAIIVD